MLAGELGVKPVQNGCFLPGDIHTNECRDLGSLTEEGSHIFFLEKCGFFQPLRTYGMCYINFTVAFEACMNIFFVYTWLERLQKPIKGKLCLRLSLQFKVIF